MSEQKKYTFGEAFLLVGMSPFIFVGLYAFFLLFSLWYAFVATKLWSWFVVPTFHLPQVSLWMMFGFDLFITLFQASPSYKDHKVDTKDHYIKMVVKPFLILLMGYIVHAYLVR